MKTLKFHEKFKSPTTAPIFQSSDGVYFRFEWNLLRAESPVLRRLFPPPTPTAAAKPTKTTTRSATKMAPEPVVVENDGDIRLFPATAFVLDFVFTSLKNTAIGAAPPPLSTRVTTDELNNILAFAAAYEMPLVTRCLYKAAKTAPLGAATVFVLAVVAGETKFEVDLCLDLLSLPPNGLSKWAQTLLKKHNPDALIALAELHYQFSKALRDCHKKLGRLGCRSRHLDAYDIEPFENVCDYFKEIYDLMSKIGEQPKLLKSFATVKLEDIDISYTACFEQSLSAIRTCVLDCIPPSTYTMSLSE